MKQMTGTDAPAILDANLFDDLVELARTSPRLRTNHNFHRNMDENPHRFLNVMLRGTYVAPHRHLNPPKSESFIVLRGEIAFFTLDEEGRVVSATVLGQDPVGIDIQPGIWHTLVVLSDYAVCFEVKPSPYSASNDKDFAVWAPREGEPGTAAYLQSLLERVPGCRTE